MSPVNLSSRRAREAKLGQRIGKAGYRLLYTVFFAATIAAFTLYFSGQHKIGFLLGALALICIMPAIWWKRQLSVLPPNGQDLTGRLSADVLVRLRHGIELNPQTVWEAVGSHWQARFILNHLLLTKEVVAEQLSQDEATLQQALDIASQLAERHQTNTIELGFVAAGLMVTAPAMHQLLTQIKAQPSDIEAVTDWLGRNLSGTLHTKRTFGGVGRDWAFGFTPLLDRFGSNISIGIAKYGAQYDWLADSDGVKAIEAAFNNHAGAVAIVGPYGVGKTQSVHALAQRLIEGNTVPELAYHQIIALNATDITSQAHAQGDLEQIMISLVNEAAQAKHVILFFDDAEAFFFGGPGTFDATQILLSIIQAKTVPIIMAMTNSDLQRLKSQNQSLASLLMPVVLQELPEADIMRILSDITVGLETRNKVLVAYEALRAAYRLSGRYEQDEAYPGKAIKLLEQSMPYSQDSVVTARSVEQVVEQTRGVKVAGAAPAEADTLLNLEDTIHQRMINQSHAVSVVSNALRRARAGVTNPKRPIGSFLFLGPTGVGKTELAKSVAAVYFDSEASMIRLDMSEYQQPEDVQRLLATGQSETASLLLQVRQQPFSVVLLDEIEKAHPNILNLLLQLLDEGQLTDVAGRAASFKDCVIIATSNAGANTIREKVGQGQNLEAISGELTDELINSGQFKPELLNRFDEMVYFRPLTPEELAQVVALMVNEVNETLANQNISIELTPPAIAKIVAEGNDPRLGARPMRRELQRVVENVLAQKILKGEAQPGDHIILNDTDLA